MPLSRSSLALLLVAAAALAADPLSAQGTPASTAPTITAESAGEVQLPGGGAPSFTITTTCPSDGEGSRCALWIEPASDGAVTPRAVQWRITRAGDACGSAARDAFRDVVASPAAPILSLAKGARCTLTFAFRLAGGESASAADVVEQVSLFVTTP
jgi:hypothetical protein